MFGVTFFAIISFLIGGFRELMISNTRSLLPSFSCRLCRTWIISRGRSTSHWFLQHWLADAHYPRHAVRHIPSPFFRHPSSRNLNPLVSTCKCLVYRLCNPTHVRSPGMTSVQSIVLKPLPCSAIILLSACTDQFLLSFIGNNEIYFSVAFLNLFVRKGGKK